MRHALNIFQTASLAPPKTTAMFALTLTSLIGELVSFVALPVAHAFLLIAAQAAKRATVMNVTLKLVNLARNSTELIELELAVLAQTAVTFVPQTILIVINVPTAISI